MTTAFRKSGVQPIHPSLEQCKSCSEVIEKYGDVRGH